MLKRLSILTLSLLMVVPAMAQPKESCECVFAPKAGQWQFELNVGQGQFFNDMSGLYYLLPSEDGGAIGVGIDSDSYDVNNGLGNSYISSDLSKWAVNNGSLNYTLPNLTASAKYFITDHININLGVGYIGNIQPAKDYMEGENFSIDGLDVDYYDVSDVLNKVDLGDVYSHKAILGAVSHRLFVQLGSEYYFNTANQRIFPYVGVFGQFKMARIESFYPYTGMTVKSDIYDPTLPHDLKYEEADLYLTPRAGQLLGFVGGINFGVEYALAEGIFVGAEVAPVAYQYTLMHLQASGQDGYYAMNHNIRAFAFPQLKIGVRF